MHLNIRSLTNKINQIRVDLPASGIDVLTVSETWLNHNTEDRLASIDGYQLTRHDRTTKTSKGTTKRGGGLCIYTNKYINLDPVKFRDSNTSDKTIEMQWVILSRPHTKDILLVNVYRPPEGSVAEAFEVISESMDKITGLDKYEILIIGDFNADASNKKTTHHQIITQFETYHQLQQMINKPTRYSEKAQTTIDLAFTNIKYCTGSGVINYNISDHKLIYILKKKPRNCKATVVRMGRSYAMCTQERLELELKKQVTVKIMEEKDPDICWALIKNIIIATADKLCPIKEERIRLKTAKYLN